MITYGRPIAMSREAFERATRIPWYHRLALRFVRGRWVGDEGKQWFVKFWCGRIYIMDER